LRIHGLALDQHQTASPHLISPRPLVNSREQRDRRKNRAPPVASRQCFT
jgi:hypothetical protein